MSITKGEELLLEHQHRLNEWLKEHQEWIRILLKKIYKLEKEIAELESNEFLEEAPHPAESWKVDKKILVSSNGIDWFHRHFALYKNGKFLVWDGGGTSWTATYKTCVEWTYAKPAEENE